MIANRPGQHAVVIGGSMAGLMTARVLADHFEHVTVLERDPIDGSSGMRKSVPQGAHLHGLLFGGQQALMALYPDWVTELERRGAVRYRVGTEAWVYMHPDGKAYSPTGAMRQPYDLGFDGYSQSRGQLEQCVRRCTLAVANVQLASGCTVHTLQCHNGRVHGVLYTHEGASQALAADLVVDAGGRGAHTPRWLAALGFPRPEETTIGIDIAHASTRFRKPAAYDAPARGISCFGPTRPYRKRALLQEIEQQTWLLSLVGRLGDYPPTAEGASSRLPKTSFPLPSTSCSEKPSGSRTSCRTASRPVSSGIMNGSQSFLKGCS